jgi:hypothetical protein
VLASQHGLEPLLHKLLAAFARLSPGWYPGPWRFGCHSILRRPPRRRPSTEWAPSSAFAGCLPLWTTLSNRSRSSVPSFTLYFFTTISVAATNRLRHDVTVPSIRTFYSLSMTGGASHSTVTSFWSKMGASVEVAPANAETRGMTVCSRLGELIILVAGVRRRPKKAVSAGSRSQLVLA